VKLSAISVVLFSISKLGRTLFFSFRKLGAKIKEYFLIFASQKAMPQKIK